MAACRTANQQWLVISLIVSALASCGRDDSTRKPVESDFENPPVLFAKSSLVSSLDSTCIDSETGPQLAVFSDGQENCFEVISWITAPDLSQTAVVHGGQSAIMLDPSDSAGIAFARTGLRASFSALELWVNGGTAGGQQVLLAVDSGSARVLATTIESALGAPLPAGEWRKVSLAFASVTPGDDVMIRVQGNTGSAQAPIYIDDVQLVSATAGTCAPGAVAGASCSDGDPCNGSEFCAGTGECLRGPRPVEDDSNGCTMDSCMPGIGVVHEPVPAGTSCTYGSTCGGQGVCDGAGTCLPAAPPTNLIIYDDHVENCFDAVGDGLHDFAESTFVHGGAHAIRIDSGFVWMKTDSLTGQYGGLELWVSGGLTGGQWIWVDVRYQGGELGSQGIDNLFGSAEWGRITVPFSTVSSPGTLEIYVITDSVHEAVYVDDVRLVGQAIDPCPLGTPAGTSCSDGNACNGEEICDGFGSCLAGQPPRVDDDNPCSADSCDPAIGVVHTVAPAGTSCSDGSLCNGLETCNGAGVCEAGTPLPLDDGNPCTVDSCDPALGAVHAAAPAGTSCSDGNACNGLESCNDAGVCTAGAPPVLDDGNPCTIDSCDPVLGVIHSPANAGTSCSDGNVCNGEEECNGSGACVAGVPPAIDDGDACTADACYPGIGVIHSPIPNCGLLPPDPATVAPPIDPTVATDIATSTTFLYSGSNPIQTGVVEGTIEARRVAVIRGHVVEKSGNPIPGVRIAILGHPEFGTTLTRADGMFDIAVNGGGLLTINYQKDAYLPAQRQVQTPWRDYIWIDEVVLVPYDTVVNTIALGASMAQVARGSPVTDADGMRQATILFPPGTQASMVMSDGTTQPISAMHVRATEYTVGPAGPKAMPATLPPTSAYTYAIELSVDEAVMAAATSVQFDRPVAFYAENFLGFPVGTVVPVGYYDRTKGAWVPSDDGRVVKILSITAGRADLDTNGDGQADDATALATLGVTAEERAQLAATYAPGTTLWRAPITHFSAWDCNWPYGCEANPDGSPACEPPNQPPPGQDGPIDNPDCHSGSIIECQNQVLGEAVPVTGTPFSLHYRSNRVPGHNAGRVLSIPVTGSTVPWAAVTVSVQIEIAGRTVTRSFTPAPNIVFAYEWDGLDAYGRPVEGAALARVYLGYSYRQVYLGFAAAAASSRSFGAMSAQGVQSVGVRDARIPVDFRQEYDVWLYDEDQRGRGLGGWSFSEQHYYNVSAGILLKGDGTRRSSSAIGNVITRIAGGGGGDYQTGFEDGMLARNAVFSSASRVATGADGSLYISDLSRVYRATPDGRIWAVAGDGTWYSGADGEGVPATSVMLNRPRSVVPMRDGSVLIAEQNHHRIRRVDRDGLIWTFGGTGVGGYSGDDGPATECEFYEVFAIATGPDDSVYVLHKNPAGGRVIRRIGADGIVSTIAGGLGYCSRDEGIPAATACVDGPYFGAPELAIGPDGAIHWSAGSTVKRIGTDGLVRTVAGSSSYCANCTRDDGHPATQTYLSDVQGLSVGPDGSLYLAMYDYRIRRVGPDQIVTTIAGTGTLGPTLEGALAAQTGVSAWDGGSIGPDGALYFAGDSAVYRVASAVPGVGALNLYYGASADGRELYVFDAGGRHLRTLDTLSNAVVYEFSYDSAGRLVSVKDRDGLVTTIERSGGVPTSIVSPHGQRTTLSVDGNGYLSSITNPAGESRRYSYYANGLMQTFADPRSNVHTFHYDDVGRFVLDENPSGGTKRLSRTDYTQGYSVSVTTALGRTALHDVKSLSAGEEVRTLTNPDGTATVTTEYANGAKTIVSPEGTTISRTSAPDPRFGMQSSLPASGKMATPSGRTLQTSQTASVVLQNPADVLSLTSRTDQFTVNGRTSTREYDAATRTLTATTAAGRKVITGLDSLGRPVSMQLPGAQLIAFGRDQGGQLRTITQGSRTTVIDYDTAGWPWRITDPAGRQTELQYDRAGRIVSRSLPGGLTVGFAYDASGNATALTPPGRPVHGFSYTPTDLTSSYTPPPAPNTGLLGIQYSYDLDGALAQVLLPDHGAIAFGSDAAGRLVSVTTDRGTSGISYDSAGRVATVTAPDGGALAYSYDGFLTLSETSLGAFTGTVGWTYDNDFRVATTSVNGSSISYQYDADSLLTGAGALAISRDTSAGRIRGTVLGAVTTTQSHSEYGELTSFSASTGGSTPYSYSFTRDLAGRITVKTETVQGVTDTYVYSYDDSGRLATVSKDGHQTASYVYDDNGNRLSSTTDSGTSSGSYDDQDRMFAYGAATYGFRPNGELAAKAVGGQTTLYDYDAFGNLRAAVLPDGRQIEYVIDGNNRRVGKKVDGTLVEGFLYDGQLRPVAWVDGVGALKARFVYGTRVNVPEYMVTVAGTFRIITDHLGSPRLVVNTSTGAVAERVDYDEWGQVLSDTNPVFQPFGFAGGLYDRDTGLVRFGARDYDPSAGRWANKDPMRFAGGTTNLYEYAANDPINVTDPSGLYAPPTFPVSPVAAAFGVGWLIGSVINHFAEDWIQEQLDTIFGPPGSPVFTPNPSDPEPADAGKHGSGGGIGLNACLDACAGGTAAREGYARRLSNQKCGDAKINARRMWSVVAADEQTCRNMCVFIHGNWN